MTALADPYRSVDESAQLRRIASRSRLTAVGTVVVCLLGSVAPLFADTIARASEPAALAVWLFFPVGVFFLVRSLRELSIPQRIETTSRGLHAVWHEPVPLLPWARRREVFIAWDEVTSIRTRSVSVNGVGDTTLVIGTKATTAEVPDGGFDVTMEQVQTTLLDMIAARNEAALSEAGVDPAPKAEALSRRYAEPEILRAQQAGNVATVLFLSVLATGPTVLAFAVPFWLTIGMATIAALLFGTVLVVVVRSAYRSRVLCLTADGIHVGPSPDTGRSIAWRNLRVRKRVLNGRTVAIELHDHEGTKIVLGDRYGLDRDALAAMLDPT